MNASAAPSQTATSGRDIYAKAGLFGLALFFVGVFVVVVAVLIEDPSEIGFILFFVVPGAIVAAALRMLRRWGLLLGILGALFGLMFMMDSADVLLTTPQAFFDFTGAWFLIPGLLILLVASIAGTAQYFRGTPRSEVSPTEMKAARVFVGVLAALALISAILTILNQGGVSAEEAQGATVVTAKKTEWDTERVQGRAGQTIKIVVKNSDPFLHTFTVADFGIDERIGPGSEKLIEIPSPRAGAYGFICRIFDHEMEMTGVIEVQ